MSLMPPVYCASFIKGFLTKHQSEIFLKTAEDYARKMKSVPPSTNLSYVFRNSDKDTFFLMQFVEKIISVRVIKNANEKVGVICGSSGFAVEDVLGKMQIGYYATYLLKIGTWYRITKGQIEKWAETQKRINTKDGLGVIQNIERSTLIVELEKDKSKLYEYSLEEIEQHEK